MRRTIAVLVVFLLFATASAHADTVRGKVVYADGVTAYPNVAVTLQNSAGRSGTAYTGSDGMFYLEQIPAGEYTMEVKTAKETKTLKISVQPQPYTDVAPVKMN
jgi:hypothetical protein